MRAWIALLACCSLGLCHAQSSSNLVYFWLGNSSWGQIHNCMVDNAAHTITLEVGYLTQLDSLRFEGIKAMDNSYPDLYDLTGQLIPQSSLLKLDASLKARFEVVSKDGKSRTPYTLSIVRLAPSSSTKPYSLQFLDDASNIASVFAFETENFIDSVHGLIQLALSPGDPLDFSKLHLEALTSEYESMTVLLAQGDTLHKDEYLALSANGEVSLFIQAEDGHAQPYTLRMTRPEPSAVTAISALRISNTSRWDTLSRFPCLTSYGITASLENTGVNTIDTVLNRISIEVPFRSPMDLGKVLLSGLQSADTNATLKFVDKNGKGYPEGYLSFLADPDTVLYVKAENRSIRAYTLEVKRARPSSSTRISTLRIYDEAGYDAYMESNEQDSAQGTITIHLSKYSRLNMSTLHLKAWDSYGFVLPILSATGDTLNSREQVTLHSTKTVTLDPKDRVTLDSNGKLSLGIMAEDGHIQAYTLSIIKAPPPTDTLPYIIDLTDFDYHQVTAYTFEDCLHCIDNIQRIVTFRPNAEDSLDLKTLRIKGENLDGIGIVFLDLYSAFISDVNPLKLDSLGTASFYVKTLNGSLVPYTLVLVQPGLEETKPLYPAPSLVLDWREALRSSQGEASLHSLDGRLLWKAPLPLSQQAMDERRRDYNHPLILRLGYRQWLLPSLK